MSKTSENASVSNAPELGWSAWALALAPILGSGILVFATMLDGTVDFSPSGTFWGDYGRVLMDALFIVGCPSMILGLASPVVCFIAFRQRRWPIFAFSLVGSLLVAAWLSMAVRGYLIVLLAPRAPY